jgi:hypothetical protein
LLLSSLHEHKIFVQVPFKNGLMFSKIVVPRPHIPL